MRTLYIDNDYKCHVLPSEGLREVIDTTEFFEGKCEKFVEGFLFIPVGEVCIINGIACTGMIAPWKSYNELYIAQLEYELADADAALAELGVNVDGL